MKKRKREKGRELHKDASFVRILQMCPSVHLSLCLVLHIVCIHEIERGCLIFLESKKTKPLPTCKVKAQL
jgi:hypothetical protein